MRSKPIPFVLIAVLALAVGWFAFQDHANRLAAERDLADQAQRRSRLDAEIATAEQRIAAATAGRQRTPTVREAAAKNPPATPPVRQAPMPMTALRNALLNDPQLQNLQLAAVQPKLRSTYELFTQQAQLSEAKAAEFFALLRKRGEQEMDLGAIRETRGLAGDDPALVQMKRQAAEEFRAAQATLLGEEGVQKLEAYERSVPAREFINEFAGAATVAGAPVTGAQADALVEAMAAASASYQQGGAVAVQALDWDRVLGVASGTLGAAEFTLFKNAAVQLRNMTRMRQLAGGK